MRSQRPFHRASIAGAPLVVATLIFGSAAVGQPGTDVVVSAELGNESEVIIDVNPTEPNNQVVVGHAPLILILGEGFRRDTMNTFFSTNRGQLWTAVPLGESEDGLEATGSRFDPAVAFDDDGTVYVAYGVPTQNGNTIVVAKSTNGGQTYSQFTQVDTNAANDKWHLAAGPDPLDPGQQNVYVAWTRAEPDQKIVLSASTDGGNIFSTPVEVNDPGATNRKGFAAEPAVGPNGEVYVAWLDFVKQKVFVDVSLNAGAKFGTDQEVTEYNSAFALRGSIFIPASPDPGRPALLGPTLDVDRSGGPFHGRLYVVYTNLGSGGDPDTDVFVRFSKDGGVNWSGPTRVNDDTGSNSQFLPWLDVDQETGLVAVVWYDARNDPNNKKVEVFTAVSDDGGATFLPNILVSDGRSDQSVDNTARKDPDDIFRNYLEYIGVAASGCEVFPVWADNSSDPGNLDFLTDRVRFSGSDTALCNEPPVCDADGPYVEECQGASTSIALDGTGSIDPEGGSLSHLWSTDCAGGSFDDPNSATPVLDVDSSSQPVSCTATLSVTDTDGRSATCSSDLSVFDTTPPAITCPAGTTIECDQSSDPSNTGTASVTDVCDPSVATSFWDATSPGACPEESRIARTWTGTDASGNVRSCLQSIDVVDTTPPQIECHAPDTLTPPDAPVSFTATASDNCASDLSVEVVGFDCFSLTKKGKRIDKRESCVVTTQGDTITIQDTGGVDDRINWEVMASDSCGNVSEAVCKIEIIRQRKPGHS
jgi:hypothetical protein